MAIQTWSAELQPAVSLLQVGPDIVITIAANKCDLEKQRSVPEATIAAYSSEIGASHFNTSAKTGAGLEEAFVDLAKRCLERQHAQLAREASVGAASQSGPRRRHGGLVIADDSVPPPLSANQSSCC